MDEWTWKAVSLQIDGFLDKAYECHKVGNEIGRNFFEQQARWLWERYKNLRPLPKDQGAVKSFLNWINKVRLTVAPLERGQTWPVLSRPVAGVSKVPSRLFSIKSIDPLMLLQMREWIVDYGVAKYCTPEIQDEYQRQKEFEKCYWTDYYFGGGYWGKRYPNNDEGYQCWKNDNTI